MLREAPADSPPFHRPGFRLWLELVLNHLALMEGVVQATCAVILYRRVVISQLVHKRFSPSPSSLPQHTDTDIYTDTHTYVYIDTHTHIDTHTDTHTHIHRDTDTQMHTHTQTQTHIHTQTHTETHSHTHTHRNTHHCEVVLTIILFNPVYPKYYCFILFIGVYLPYNVSFCCTMK